MKYLSLGALAATLLFATPSFAQDLRIRAGEGGISVRAGEDRPGYRRGRGPDRVIIREGRSERYGRSSERCRDITVRSERPNGTVVIRRERRCR
ncbi:MAG: hypothetical protein Q8S29_03065 [Phreatobacter sp.]|nr:hypothetical protein [Phreatobacter sp.]